MNDTAERQRYRLATGQSLTPAPDPKPNPGYSKGGKARMGYKKGGMKRPTTGRGR